MFIVKNVGKTSVPDGVCASKTWLFSSALWKFNGAAHLRLEIWFFKQNRFQWVKMHILNVVANKPKFTELFSPNADGIAVDHLGLVF